jgi:hypothetical protein
VPLIATATAPNCKVCTSGRVEEANSWLDRRGELDENGLLLTHERLANQVLPILLGCKVSVSSLKRHVKLHTEKVSSETATAVADATAEAEAADRELLLAEMDVLLSGGPFINPSAFRSLQLRAYLLDLRRKVAAGGEMPKLTPDQAGRAASDLQAVRESSERGALLDALGGAISSVFTRQFAEADKPVEIEAGEVIEGDAVEAAEDTETAA